SRRVACFTEVPNGLRSRQGTRCDARSLRPPPPRAKRLTGAASRRSRGSLRHGLLGPRATRLGRWREGAFREQPVGYASQSLSALEGIAFAARGSNLVGPSRRLERSRPWGRSNGGVDERVRSDAADHQAVGEPRSLAFGEYDPLRGRRRRRRPRARPHRRQGGLRGGLPRDACGCGGDDPDRARLPGPRNPLARWAAANRLHRRADRPHLFGVTCDHVIKKLTTDAQRHREKRTSREKTTPADLSVTLSGFLCVSVPPWLVLTSEIRKVSIDRTIPSWTRTRWNCCNSTRFGNWSRGMPRRRSARNWPGKSNRPPISKPFAANSTSLPK